jgi:hypothetical protein
MQDVPEKVSCRACEAPIRRDTAVCPSCGTKEPWIPDEPRFSPRLVSVIMWGSGIVVTILLLFVAWMLAFGPAATEDDRDHRPPTADSPAPREAPEK